MMAISITTALVAIAQFIGGEDELAASTPELVEAINAARHTWRAVHRPGLTVGQFRRMQGSATNRTANVPRFFRPFPSELVLGYDEIPSSLDAREYWPQCADIIGHVRNQGPCGDCWGERCDAPTYKSPSTRVAMRAPECVRPNSHSRVCLPLPPRSFWSNAVASG